MFGCYRTYLALMVFWGHLLQLSGLGQYAVFGFYALSGYLMTTIMSRSYGYTRQGRTRYLINRFLRIYPVWWSSLTIAVIVLAIVGKERATMFHSSMYLPSDFTGWLQNISLVFPSMKPIDCSPRISPSIWALTVELFFYGLICLGISKTRRATWLWFLLSCGYVLYTYWAELDFGSRYFPILAASLPFSIGSLIHHYPKFMG
ncbi:acyltransferase family protein, partial [Rhodopirellula bahusiensis]